MNTPAPQETYEARRARERAEKCAMAETSARDIAAAMTAHTGEPWHGTPEPDCYEPRFELIRDRDGLRFTLSATNYQRPAAWEVYAASVDLPNTDPAPDASPTRREQLHNHRRREEHLSVKIGRTKPPAQVARDIARRLLPLAEELTARAEVSRLEAIDRTAWLEAAATRLCAACPVPLERVIGAHDHERILRHYGEPRITVKLQPFGQSIQIEVADMPLTTAAAALATLTPESLKH